MFINNHRVNKSYLLDFCTVYLKMRYSSKKLNFFHEYRQKLNRDKDHIFIYILLLSSYSWIFRIV